jgi:hypothetical protein
MKYQKSFSDCFEPQRALPVTVSVSARGPWRDRHDLRDALREHAPRLIIGGCELYDLDTRYRHQIDTTPDTLGSVVTCTHTEPTLATAREMQRATSALAAAGATEVRVVNSGLTHAAVAWRQLTESRDLFSLYAAFVRFVTSDALKGSCGMHAFGQPDVEVIGDVDLAEASNAVSAFNLYVLERRPLLATGHWFSWRDEGPRFRLRRAPSRLFRPDDSRHNPQGVWQLQAH